MHVADSKNKLVRSITEEQLIEFLNELVRTPNVTGAFIQEEALKRFNVEIGHNSANEFRRDIFGSHIEKLRHAARMAQMVNDHRQPGGSNTLADAASDLLQQQVFEFMVEAKLDLAKPADLKQAESLGRIIKSARAEDRKQIDQLNERVKELEDKTGEAEEVAADTKLSDAEKVARWKNIFGR